MKSSPLILAALLCLLVTGCAMPGAPRTYSATGSGTQLPDAQGATWYCITVDGMRFQGRRLALLSGQLSLPADTAGQTCIDVPGGLSTADARWQAGFAVYNQQPLSITLRDAEIRIRVNDQLTVALSRIDEATLAALIAAEEGFQSGIHAMEQGNPALKSLYSGFFATPGVVSYVPAAAVIDQLPGLYVNDGPALKKPPVDQGDIYLKGFSKGGKRLLNWVHWSTGATGPALTYQVLTQDIASGRTLSQLALPLDARQPMFWLYTWLTHVEFINYWQQLHPGQPVPAILPADAGIVVRNALNGFDWLSNITAGDGIVIRSDVFGFAFPAGQPVVAFIGQPLLP